MRSAKTFLAMDNANGKNYSRYVVRAGCYHVRAGAAGGVLLINAKNEQAISWCACYEEVLPLLDALCLWQRKSSEVSIERISKSFDVNPRPC